MPRGSHCQVQSIRWPTGAGPAISHATWTLDLSDQMGRIWGIGEKTTCWFDIPSSLSAGGTPVMIYTETGSSAAALGFHNFQHLTLEH